MSTKIQKWGNSLGVRIPKGVIEGARIKEGTVVEFYVEGSHIMFRPVKRKAVTLADLLKNAGPDDFDEKAYWGSPRGKEVW